MIPVPEDHWCRPLDACHFIILSHIILYFIIYHFICLFIIGPQKAAQQHASSLGYD